MKSKVFSYYPNPLGISESQSQKESKKASSETSLIIFQRCRMPHLQEKIYLLLTGIKIMDCYYYYCHHHHYNVVVMTIMITTTYYDFYFSSSQQFYKQANRFRVISSVPKSHSSLGYELGVQALVDPEAMLFPSYYEA